MYRVRPTEMNPCLKSALRIKTCRWLHGNAIPPHLWIAMLIRCTYTKTRHRPGQPELTSPEPIAILRGGFIMGFSMEGLGL